MVEQQPTEGGLYAASMDVRHDCAVGNVSRRLPDLRILQWSMSHRDIFQATGPEPQLNEFREAVVSQFGGRHVYSTEDGMILVTEEGCHSFSGRAVTISTILSSVGVWDIPPIVYREGWESWRVIAWSDRSVREMFAEIRKIGELRLGSLRPIENLETEKMMLMPASDIFTGLTDRRSSALLLGLRHGYYGVPSGTDIRRLADGAGLSASTFSEHLRKAEARILQNLRPYLEAYAVRAPGELAVAEVRDVPILRSRGRDAVPSGS